MPRIPPGGYAARVLDNFSDEDASPRTRGQNVEQLGGSVLKYYVEACTHLDDNFEQDDVFQNGVKRVREHLVDAASGGDCLICLGDIQPHEAVWSCAQGCFAMLHLVCIQDWAKNQQQAAGLRASSRLSPELFPHAAAEASAEAEWQCPKCRHAYGAKQVPRAYTCFCGKVTDPDWDPWITPHSCGEMCGRKLPGSCSHTCTLLCHPGPCPPCPRVIDASCYCKKKTVRRRCGNYQFSCSRPCSQKLECGHSCEETCHEGPCPPCPKQGLYSCACGAQKRELPCSQRLLKCDKVCGKPLACGRHVCEEVCHAGACKGCPTAGLRACPCGKKTYQDLRCDEKAPACVDTCGKLLQCGRHYCQEKCHHGPCTKVCRAMVTKACRCGSTAKQVQCHADVTCEKRCMNKRNCGRHPCKRRCCDGNCPPCEEVCSRRLRCGNHKCPAPCHSGPCQPCPLTGSVTCACGHTKNSFICGGESKVLPPRCLLACPIPPACRHASQRRAHRCHFGPCRPCTEPCGSTLACGHRCPSQTCHDAQPPPVPSFMQPKPPQLGSHASSSRNNLQQQQQQASMAGPSWSVAQTAQTLLDRGPSACPPCTHPISMTCMGRHETRELPCSQASVFQCEQRCGRPLSCGHHSCEKGCHAVVDDARALATAQGEECQTCSRPCSQPRTCTHPCTLTCHKEPCPLCTVTCRRACLCGKVTLSFPCHQNQDLQAQLSSSNPKHAELASKSLSCSKPCHKQLPHCPHPCRALCHVGPCPDPTACQEEVTVRCSCKKQKQKWKCAQVQAVLLDAGKGRDYDATAALRLLPCNSDCNAAAKSSNTTQAPARKESSTAEVGVELQRRKKSMSASIGEGERGSASEADGTDPASSRGGKRLSRQEREQLALQRQKEREQQESRRNLMRWLQRLAFLLVVIIVSAVLGRMLSSVLRKVDEHAAAKWKTDL